MKNHLANRHLEKLKETHEVPPEIEPILYKALLILYSSQNKYPQIEEMALEIVRDCLSIYQRKT